MNSQMTIAAHILAMLACMNVRGEGAATSEQLAESIGTNPVVVRRVLAKLQRAGLIESRRGVGGGSILAKPAEEINLRDAYLAVTEKETPILGRYAGSCGEHCSMAPIIASYLEELYVDAETLLLNRLGHVSIKNMALELDKRLLEKQQECTIAKTKAS
ncbi:MAG: Rrf2 family transcriptional regulator [Myxococcales bacterium]|nr:Rrf2 family transcriptional regulator [Myxococcales bacterium]